MHGPPTYVMGLNPFMLACMGGSKVPLCTIMRHTECYINLRGLYQLPRVLNSERALRDVGRERRTVAGQENGQRSAGGMRDVAAGVEEVVSKRGRERTS